MAKRFGIFPCHEKKAIMDRRIRGDRDNYKWLLMITTSINKSDSSSLRFRRSFLITTFYIIVLGSFHGKLEDYKYIDYVALRRKKFQEIPLYHLLLLLCIHSCRYST
jgi:hypothetical protein